MWICVHDCRYIQRPEEGVGIPQAGVTSGCELPEVGAGNGTLILWKNKMSQSNMAKPVYEVYLESNMVK